MLLAAALFSVAGLLNGVYPGGSGWIDRGGYGVLTYVFGFLNVLVALWIWRGSERGLLTRIILAALFLGIVAALAFSQATVVSLVVYVLTGLIEVVIFLDAIRVWRLGRAADARDLDAIFSLDAPLPVASNEPGSVVAPAIAAPAPAPGPARAPSPLSARLTWLIGLESLALAALLVANGAVAGFVPGGVEWGLYGRQSGWLVYIFAMVVLVVAVRAVHGSNLALRLLLLTGLIVFVERMFTPFQLGDFGPATLALHGMAALVALAMALTAVASLRAVEHARRTTMRITLEHATGSQ